MINIVSVLSESFIASANNKVMITKSFDIQLSLLSQHGKQMSLVDDALASFYEAIKELNATDSVTTLTIQI